MFADIDLGARIEAAEARLIAGAARSVAERRPDQNVWVREVAGGVASVMEGTSPLNKVVGLGFGGVPSERELAEVEEAFAERGAPVQVEIASLGDPEVVQALSRRGYVLMGFEDVLGAALPREVEGLPPDIRIEVSPPEAIEEWLGVIVEGFMHPDTQGVASHESFEAEVLTAVIRDMVGGTGFTRTLARRGGEPAGASSMRLDSGIAQLSGAATLPAHRRRGVQTALLRDRLRRAAEAGCDLAVVTTSPGTKSQENVQRRGFSLLYTRAVLVRS